jgi:hypothetical protein
MEEGVGARDRLVCFRVHPSHPEWRDPVPGAKIAAQRPEFWGLRGQFQQATWRMLDPGRILWVAGEGPAREYWTAD